MGNQKLLSSKKIFSANLFDVHEEILDTDDKQYTFHTAYAKSAAGVIPITPKGEIYLVDQYRYVFGKRMLGIVAGFLEDGETALQAAQRELLEEAGINAGQWELLAKSEISRSTMKQTYNIFLARDLEVGQQHLIDEEDIEVVKMPLREAVEKVMNGEIFHSPSMTAILMLDKLKQQKRL